MVERPGLHADEEGDGPRLVLVHGFTQTRRTWGPVAADLARDHRVVRVDAPGHGRSGSVVADLEEGARLLVERGGEATYLGYSMGGRLCLHAALAAPSAVQALVLVGATAGLDDPSERAARRQADEERAAQLERVGVDAFLAEWLAQPLFAGLPPGAAALEARRENTAAGLAASLRLAGTGAQTPRWRDLGRLAMPVLALAGERDRSYAALARRLAQAVGPTATAAVVPGAGHAAHLEQPAAFLAVLRRWLGERGL